MNPSNWKSFILILISSALFIASCKDDDSFFNSSNAKLNIKADTVFFDTVFTSPANGIPMSVNKQFVVVNPYDEPILTHVVLNAADRSPFRINVDGESGDNIKDIEILPKDSIFVFVEISIDPNNDPLSLPLIVRDSISFITNGNRQDVQLIAWGQDAHYIFRDSICDAVLSDVQKPYVIYGYLFVPENCRLTIGKGVKLHFSPFSWLFVEGTLIINGTENEPVVFQGDRLQPQFEEVSGQWGGIWLSHPSKDNRIQFADIKNGTVGIYCDSSSVNGAYNVEVYNTKVRNMTFDGLAGKGSSIRAQNSYFANCGRYSFFGLYGGDYNLQHCTFATFGYDFSRREPGVVLNNIERDELGGFIQSFPVQAQFQNNIIWGSQKEELALDVDRSKLGALVIENNIIRTEIEGLDLPGLGNKINADPRFVNSLRHIYGLDSLSSAKNIGKILNPPITTDIDNFPRDSKPDAGAYESRF